MQTLTSGQQRALEAILRFLETEERPPTTRELAAALGCHVKTVWQYLSVLERKGYLTRKKGRIRHGGELERVDLAHVTLATEDNDGTVLAIHEALEKLASESPQKAEIVKLRYFIGLEHGEIAQALGMSEPTVRRYWAYARSWLYAELKKNLENG